MKIGFIGLGIMGKPMAKNLLRASCEAIRGGLAGSTVMNAKAPMMMDQNFRPGFRIDLHIKDLGNVVDAAKTVDAPIPLTQSVLEMMKVLHHDGCGSDDHSALLKYYQKLTGEVLHH